jgi:hypothetical protein
VSQARKTDPTRTTPFVSPAHSARPCSRDGPALARTAHTHAVRSRCVPSPGLAPPVAAVLHPPAAAIAEVHAATELHTAVELRIDELLFSSKHQVDVSHLFKVFQMFQMYVASVLYGCCKSRSRCYLLLQQFVHICFELLFPMFHLVFYTYVANVFNIYVCKCFI